MLGAGAGVDDSAGTVAGWWCRCHCLVLVQVLKAVTMMHEPGRNLGEAMVIGSAFSVKLGFSLLLSSNGFWLSG